ncbi:MAG: hypothetical protein GY950_23895 [bacterium]|nr:hypothetical protein [bacterium]
MDKTMERSMNVKLLVIVFLFSAPFIYGEKVASFPGLIGPYNFIIDGDRVYISDGPEIFIYSLTDFRMVKKFGKRGEGPGEFKFGPGTDQVGLHVRPGYIQVNSVGRISYFFKDGRHKKDINSREGLFYKPLGEYQVGVRSFYDKKNTSYRMITIYGPGFNKVKDVLVEKNKVQPRLKEIDALFWDYETFRTYNEKLFINGKENTIHVFDKSGVKLYDIDIKGERLRVTDEVREACLRYFREYPAWRRRWHFLKNWYKFPEYLPLVHYFCVAGNKIYVLTYKKKAGKTELLELDIKGKLLKRVFLPVEMEYEVLFIFPLAFSGGNLYQLIENEAEEVWELHKTGIKY